MPVAKRTREAWMNQLATLLRPAFKELGAPIPRKVRMSCSWTSNGANSNAIGECWTMAVSKDGTWEIFITPKMDNVLTPDGQGVADILAHELVHASIGLEHGHGARFKEIAEGLGLAGPMTATNAGPGFVKMVEPLLRKCGKYPHAELQPGSASTPLPPIMVPNPKGGQPIPMPRTSGPRKQPARLLKASCQVCGYTVRVTKKWLKVGAPLCPCNARPMEHDPIED